MSEHARAGESSTHAPTALTPTDDDWRTTYEVASHDINLLFRELAAVRDSAVIEFHPDGITGRTATSGHVAMGVSEIPGSAIEESGAHCAVTVDVGAIHDIDPAFLFTAPTMTLAFDTETMTVEISNGYETEEIALNPEDHVLVPSLPNCEYETRAELPGWSFAGAIEGACGASGKGFILEAASETDLRVSARDTPWSHTVEDVIREMEFGSAKFSKSFLPPLTEEVIPGSEVTLRFGDDLPMEISIDGRTTYAVCPHVSRDDEEGDDE